MKRGMSMKLMNSAKNIFGGNNSMLITNEVEQLIEVKADG